MQVGAQSLGLIAVWIAHNSEGPTGSTGLALFVGFLFLGKLGALGLGIGAGALLLVLDEAGLSARARQGLALPGVGLAAFGLLVFVVALVFDSTLLGGPTGAFGLLAAIAVNLAPWLVARRR